MHDEMLGCFILLFWSPAGVRAVRAGCCVASAGVLVRFEGVGGSGWLMYDEVFGVFTALYGFVFVCFKGRGWGGGCRWLMHDEILGSFMLLPESPGW